MAGRSRTGVEVTGLRELVRDLQALGLEVEDLKEAFAAVAKLAAERVAARAPKLSGRLAASARGNRAKGKAVVTIGRATVPYAGPINYGWPARNITPSGFAQAADREVSPLAVARLEAEINAQIRKKGLTR